LLNSFLNFFNKSNLNDEINSKEERLKLISGILIEAAAVDGEIDKNEIKKITNSLIDFFEANEEQARSIVSYCLERVDEPNSFHFFTSKINKDLEYNEKIKLLEILWEIILSDGKVHDYESNLLRRLSGLLYISDVESGNAKKRALNNFKKQ
tara:strand:+ start:565 stop:1020 length:456 start_codon:yes stop_codon:yes gene_type:complete